MTANHVEHEIATFTGSLGRGAAAVKKSPGSGSVAGKRQPHTLEQLILIFVGLHEGDGGLGLGTRWRGRGRPTIGAARQRNVQRPPRAALAYANGAPQGRPRKNRVSESPGFSAREQRVENHLSAVGHDFTSLAWWVVVVLLLVAVLLVLILWKD
jgi:hypothetical protein